jgi:branched-chain amino acid transport system ATP-binding protein
VLDVRGLRSAYGRIEVLKSVSFEVKAGEVVALVGSNGAGKTTLLRALSGVQPITGGEIHFLGERIERTPPHRRPSSGETTRSQRTEIASTRCFRSSRKSVTSRPAASRAASSRCSPSGAH